MSHPGPHPEPPPDFDAISLPLVSMATSGDVRGALRGPWFRLHDAVHPPLHFGRLRKYRFDDPLGRFGVLYVGANPHCAFIETFGSAFLGTPMTRRPIRSLTRDALEGRRLVRVASRRRLRLVDLTGPGLSNLGADGRLCSGDYRIAQRWSRAIWSHLSKPDGLCYRARHDPSRIAVAIYDRARRGLRAIAMGSLLEDSNRRLRNELLDTYDVGLFP